MCGYMCGLGNQIITHNHPRVQVLNCAGYMQSCLVDYRLSMLSMDLMSMLYTGTQARLVLSFAKSTSIHTSCVRACMHTHTHTHTTRTHIVNTHIDLDNLEPGRFMCPMKEHSTVGHAH